MSVLSYLVGPVFYPSNGNLLSTFAHLLVGGARLPDPSQRKRWVEYRTRSISRMGVWSGAEYRLSPAFGFRIAVDYLHTHFYNSLGAVRGQNDVRIVNSIVYYPGNRIRSRRRIP